MSKASAKKIVRNYGQRLLESGFPVYAIYLFGSHVKGRTHQWSDIDVAVVSDVLKHNVDKSRLRLWQLRRAVDLRIEPHGFTVNDFVSEDDPMAYEIKQHGIRIM